MFCFKVVIAILLLGAKAWASGDLTPQEKEAREAPLIRCYAVLHGYVNMTRERYPDTEQEIMDELYHAQARHEIALLAVVKDNAGQSMTPEMSQVYVRGKVSEFYKNLNQGPDELVSTVKDCVHQEARITEDARATMDALFGYGMFTTFSQRRYEVLKETSKRPE